EAVQRARKAEARSQPLPPSTRPAPAWEGTPDPQAQVADATPIPGPLPSGRVRGGLANATPTPVEAQTTPPWTGGPEALVNAPPLTAAQINAMPAQEYFARMKARSAPPAAPEPIVTPAPAPAEAPPAPPAVEGANAKLTDRQLDWLKKREA